MLPDRLRPLHRSSRSRSTVSASPRSSSRRSRRSAGPGAGEQPVPVVGPDRRQRAEVVAGEQGVVGDLDLQRPGVLAELAGQRPHPAGAGGHLGHASLGDQAGVLVGPVLHVGAGVRVVLQPRLHPDPPDPRRRKQ